jgi:hypothetical protein
MQCHTPGDVCDQARAGFQSGLSRLDDAIRGADQVLGVAESSGMEVSEARLAQDQARDSLTKARVTIHSFRTDLVDQDIQAGLKIASKNLQAGKNAMIERNQRRPNPNFFRPVLHSTITRATATPSGSAKLDRTRLPSHLFPSDGKQRPQHLPVVFDDTHSPRMGPQTLELFP